MPRRLLAVSCLAALAGCGPPCSPGRACRAEGQRFYIAEPAGWDGVSPLPATFWFHGWNGSGKAQFDRAWLVDGLSQVGALGVFGDGKGNSWSTTHSPEASRDELPYIRAVMAEVAERYPVDETRWVAGGLSQGGSMVWEITCREPDLFSAYLPYSGTYWEAMADDCAGSPVRVRHSHGTNDSTWPLDGRAIGSDHHQGAPQAAVDQWRVDGGCSETVETIDEGDETCQVWRDCADGAEVRYCTHGGGHHVPADWAVAAHDWAWSAD